MIPASWWSCCYFMSSYWAFHFLVLSGLWLGLCDSQQTEASSAQAHRLPQVCLSRGGLWQGIHEGRTPERSPCNTPRRQTLWVSHWRSVEAGLSSISGMLVSPWAIARNEVTSIWFLAEAFFFIPPAIPHAIKLGSHLRMAVTYEWIRSVGVWKWMWPLILNVWGPS